MGAAQVLLLRTGLPTISGKIDRGKVLLRFTRVAPWLFGYRPEIQTETLPLRVGLKRSANALFS